MIYIKKWLEYYEELFPLCENQVNFIDNLANDFEKPCKYLSVECGPALVSQILANKHYDVTVTDRFSEVTSKLQTQTSHTEGLIHIFNFLPHDIARYLGKSFFNIIYCANYRLVFIRDKAYIQKLLFDAKTLLNNGGYLVLDLFNFSKYDFTKDKVELPERECNRASLFTNITVDKENITYLMNQQLVTTNNKIVDVIKSEPVYPISQETLISLVKELNYSSIEFFSDYNKSPVSSDSDKIICVLKK